MRCPKCGYISFDHNQICPKCNKDISDEQAKLNLPTYKSNTPALLGMLLGVGDESNVGFTLDSETVLHDRGGRIDFGEDDQDIEISLTDDTTEFELPGVGLDSQSGDIFGSSEDEDISLDMDEVAFEDSADTADDLDLDLGDDSMEEGDQTDEGPDFDLDKISPDDSFDLKGVPDFSPGTSEETIEIGSLTKEDTGPPDKGKSTVELNFSDLKVNETGELEFSSIPDEIVTPEGLPEEDDIDIDEIDISLDKDLEIETFSDEQMDENNSTGSLELSDLMLGSSSDLNLEEMGGVETAEIKASADIESDEEDSFDLGDLAIDSSLEEEESLDLGDLILEDDEDSTAPETMSRGAMTDEEDSLDLGDLAMEDVDEEDFDLSDFSLDGNETGELRLSDSMGKQIKKGEPDNESAVFDDDELSIDLENLDLDLELDDSLDEK